MRKLFNGYILVEFDTYLIHETSTGLILNPEFEPEFHQGVTGTVKKVCEEKYTYRDWNPQIRVDCEAGDRVIMHYLGCQTALESGLDNKRNGTWFLQDGKLMAIIHYSFVMAIKRDGILKAAPGYVLARRVVRKEKDSDQWVISREEEHEAVQFQLVSVGEDIIPRAEAFMPGLIKPGDVVMTDASCGYELEPASHMVECEEPLVCFDKYLVYGLVA